MQLSPQRMQAIGVKTALVEMQSVSNELRVPGQCGRESSGSIAYVQTRFPGWIQKVFANATYQYVRKGQPLFTIYSPSWSAPSRSTCWRSRTRNPSRETRMGQRSREGDWLLQAAADRLRQFGVPPSEIARLEQTGTVQHDITIESPASGYITEFNALPNQYVASRDEALHHRRPFQRLGTRQCVSDRCRPLSGPGMPATVTVDALSRAHVQGANRSDPASGRP